MTYDTAMAAQWGQSPNVPHEHPSGPDREGALDAVVGRGEGC